MSDYKYLNVWRESMDLVESIYRLIKFLSQEEFVQFLYISLGSASEVETQLLIVKRLNYLQNIENELNQIGKIRRIINALIN